MITQRESTGSADVPASAGRLPSLDGLRGVAALIVMIHHGLLTFPAFAGAYLGPAGPAAGTAAWWLTYTPAHLVWAGGEAVWLFFVLSGVVLTLPVLRSGERFSWFGYFGRRVARLYLPVWAAVLVTLLLVTLVPRFSDPALGSWMAIHADGYDWRGIALDATLLLGTSGVNTPLWSLPWEVFFSLLLPLFVLAALWCRRWWWLAVAALLLVMLAGERLGIPAAIHLPVFAVGAVLAAAWGQVGVLAQRLSRWRGAWPAILTLALGLTTVRWSLVGLGLPAPSSLVGPDTVVGVATLVVAAAWYRPLRRLLRSRLCQWLGTVSFSLYLIHEPVITTARLLTFPAGEWTALVIAWPASLLIAHGFARWIEAPAHRLARRIGQAAEQMLRGAPGDPGPPPGP
ncbi:MAG: acyltransferase family protein [Propioniciclava sp.]